MRKELTGYRHKPYRRPLGDDMWTRSALGQQSREFTLIYIDRYYGPRTKRSQATHPFWELGCVVQGEGRLIGRRHMALTPNMVFLVPPQTPHTELSETDIDIIWLGLKGTRMSAEAAKQTASVTNMALTASVKSLWLFAEARRAAVGPELEGMALTIVARLLRLLREGEAVEGDLMDRAILFVRERFAQPLTVRDIARHVGYSEGHLRRQFRARTGMSPIAYLEAIRIQHAQRLLEHTELPVSEVANAVGYRDSFYFSRVFSKATGGSPSQFRKHVRP